MKEIANWDQKREKYLQEKINLISAAVTGVLMGQAMFGKVGGESMGENVKRGRDSAMKLIERDVRQIAKYFSRK